MGKLPAHTPHPRRLTRAQGPHPAPSATRRAARVSPEPRRLPALPARLTPPLAIQTGLRGGGPACVSPSRGGRGGRERCDSNGGAGTSGYRAAPSPSPGTCCNYPGSAGNGGTEMGHDPGGRCRQRGSAAPLGAQTQRNPAPVAGVRAVPLQRAGASRLPGVVCGLPAASPPGGSPARPPPPPGFDATSAQGVRGEKLNSTALSGWFLL